MGVDCIHVYPFKNQSINNPQQENNFVFLSPFHSIFVIYTPNMLSERVSGSSCSEKETMCFISAQFST